MIPKIPILSLKGGTGKTTICISIARALRDMGYHVGVLDVDVHASALPRAIGLIQPPGYKSVEGGYLQPITHDGIKVFSIGLLFPESTPNMWPDHMKADGVRQIATTSIAWGDLDWLVVDTPPTSGTEVQVLLDKLTDVYGAVIVCQPNELAVLGITKTLEVLREKQTPISGIVANMAGYKCPNCGVVSNPFDRTPEDVETLARNFRVRFLGSVPFGQEEQRAPSIVNVTRQIIENKPVILKAGEGGAKRWVLKNLLRWTNL